MGGNRSSKQGGKCNHGSREPWIFPVNRAVNYAWVQDELAKQQQSQAFKAVENLRAALEALWIVASVSAGN